MLFRIPITTKDSITSPLLHFPRRDVTTLMLANLYITYIGCTQKVEGCSLAFQAANYAKCQDCTKILWAYVRFDVRPDKVFGYLGRSDVSPNVQRA